MIHLENEGNFAVVPKINLENPTITIFDKFSETTTQLNYTELLNESGYLIVFYTFEPVNDRQYYIKIIENNIIAWQGTAIGVQA